MPCGGIFPIKGSFIEPHNNPEWPCWQCNKGNCDVFCMEWDTPLHSACVEAFLKTEEGECVLGHGHAVVILDGEDREVVLHEEVQARTEQERE